MDFFFGNTQPKKTRIVNTKSAGLTTKMKHGRQTKKREHLRSKMNCSPAVSGKRLANTCYTPQILEMIRRSYNRDHSPADHITETDPTEIWKSLNAKLAHCAKEDCWLNQIKDKTLRKKIDRYIFAPDQPYEWKRNHTEWLSNYDIFNVLEQYELTYSNFKFIGPTPIDFDTRLGNNAPSNPYSISSEETVPEKGDPSRKCIWNELCQFSLKSLMAKGKRKIGIVFNLDKHDESGSHWVSMFIDVSRRFMFYFDSAGGEMPPEIRKLMDRVHKQSKQLGIPLTEYTNGSHTHQRGNTECGMYSLFFIITMLTGRPTHHGKRMPLEKILHMFLKDRLPDKTMENYRDEYFNVFP